MRGGWVAFVLALAVLFGTAVAIAQVGSTPEEAEQAAADEGLPPFLTGGEEMPPGLAKRDVPPPGLAKKLTDDIPPGQSEKDGGFVPPGLAEKGEGWLPPGLAKKGKIPPGHAKRLGVEPEPGTDPDDD